MKIKMRLSKTQAADSLPVTGPFGIPCWVTLIAALLTWPALSQAQGKAALPALESKETPAVDTPPDTEMTRPGAAPGRALKLPQQTIASGTPLQAGSFLVYPEIDVTWLYDDNLYFSNTAPVSDHAVIYSPALWVQSNWARHALNFHAAADATRYNNYSAENSDDYRLSAEGRYDFSSDSNIYGGIRVSNDHEDRESPDARNGLTPTRYQQHRYYGGIFKQLDRWWVRVAGTAQQLDYHDVNFQTGSGAINIINNDDRDRWQYTGGVRVGYELSPRIEPYAQIAFDNRRYKDAVDDLGYRRDSNGERYLIGVKWNMPKLLKLDAFAGWLRQDYEDARLATVSSPVAGAALLWAVANRTTLSAYLDRTVEETTVSQTVAPGVIIVSSSYLNTYLSLGVNHRLNDKWSVRAGGSVSRTDYQGLDRTDDYYGANIGFVYHIHRNLLLDVDLSHRELQSSIPTEDFKKHVLFVRLAIPFSN